MDYLEASKPSTSPQSSIIIVSASPGIQAGSLSELMVKQVNAFLNEHQQYEPAFAGSDKELVSRLALSVTLIKWGEKAYSSGHEFEANDYNYDRSIG